MRCHEFESRLQAVLDERDEPRADVELSQHAADCADCRQLLAGMMAAVAEARAPVACPPELTWRVLDSLRPRQPGLRRWFAMPLAAAASLLIAAGIGVGALYVLAPRLHPQAHNPQIATNDRHAGKAEASALNQPTEPGWPLMPQLSDFSARTSHEMDADLNHFGDDVREGLSPVTRSTAGALQSLWQAFSPAEDTRS